MQRDKNAVVKYLNSVGLDTHEEADVCTECVGMGMVVDGKRREVRPRAERVSRLRKASSVITAVGSMCSWVDRNLDTSNCS